MDNDMVAERLWVLVEGPGPGDAGFLGHWLLAAVEADQALHEQFRQEPDLKEQIGRLEVVYSVRFSSTATRCVELLMKDLASFSLAICEEPFGEIFTVMAELHFFRRTGDRYQMTIPKEISGSSIAAALLRLAATEDDEYFLHPERLVTCLAKPDAERWQLRLERLPWTQRMADRNLLLEDTELRQVGSDWDVQ